jgi:tight adherence protein B
MPQEILVPFILIFAGVVVAFLAVWIIVSSIASRRRQHFERRMAAGDSEPSLTLIEGVGPQSLSQRMDTGFTTMISRTGLDLDSSLAMAIILFSGVILAAVMFVWRYEEEPWLAIPGFLVGAAIPFIFFLWRQGVWRRTLQNQLPDALYLLARSIRAGRSIDQAFQLVGDQGVPPLSREFARMYRQMELGLSLTQVLQTTARRLNLIDFNVFASVLSPHRSTGGNLPVILDRLAAATRDRNQFEGQYRAATVLGRYSAAFICSLAAFILIYLFFFQREWAMRFFDISQGYTGVVLFTTAIMLELMGGMLLFWFLKHDY